VTTDEVWIGEKFIDHLQVVITNNFKSTAVLHAKNHSAQVLSGYFHNYLFGNSSPKWLFLCNVFTTCFLVTNVSNGDSSAWLTLHSWTFICTALTRWTRQGRSSHTASERTHREHRLHHLFYCVTSPRRRMLRALHSNGCMRLVL
jgi:hypothetical protein